MRFDWIFIFACVLRLSSSVKILSIVSARSKSHHNVVERLLIELTKKGHEVTLVTPFELSKPVTNLTVIIRSDSHKTIINMTNTQNTGRKTKLFQIRYMPKWIKPFIPSLLWTPVSESVFSTPEIQKLIQSEEKFDLILCETIFSEGLVAGFAHKNKASIIGIASFMPNYYTSFLVNNPAPAAYVPDTFLGHSNKMSFWERLENKVLGFLIEANFQLHYLQQDAMMRKYFGDDLPPLDHILRNTSLVLVNHHFSLAFPRPYLPNMIEIGGYHINPPKPLPTDLQNYLDRSKEGVILFSLGSYIRSADLSNEKKQEISKSFSRLKQDILWKFEDDTLRDLPKNVKILKWVPQSDILAHPNLKLFITHGGLLSTTEAVARGVPIVGIPVTTDQFINIKFTTAAGFGVSLDLDDLNERNLYEAVMDVLNNPKYKRNVKQGSALIHDTPLPAIDTALYWIEYVIRNKGAPLLRSAAQDLAWYQLYMLDVLGFIFLVTSFIIVISFHITKFIVKQIIDL